MVIAPAHRAGDPRSIPGPGENFFSEIINIDITVHFTNSRNIPVFYQLLYIAVIHSDPSRREDERVEVRATSCL